jgi:hypothetical protein
VVSVGMIGVMTGRVTGVTVRGHAVTTGAMTGVTNGGATAPVVRAAMRQAVAVARAAAVDPTYRGGAGSRTGVVATGTRIGTVSRSSGCRFPRT